MEIKAQTVNFKNVEVEVSSRMTIEAWENLLEQMPENPKWPVYQFISAIKSAVGKVKSNMEFEEIK